MDDPTDLIAEAGKVINISYHRFNERMGGHSLAGHWNRCLSLINDEPWIWFLPDDDLPSLNCVEELVLALQRGLDTGVNIFTLPLKSMDEDGKIFSHGKFYEFPLNNLEFYRKQLSGEIEGSTLGDNIIRREALIGRGGFVDFPKAWGSDHATLIRASAGANILCLSNAFFCFRNSRVNISSLTYDGGLKMKARLLFACWIRENSNLFSGKLDHHFWELFYWKSEFFAVNVWPFSARLFWYLLRLRWVCIGSLNFLSVLKLLMIPKQ